MNVNAASKVPDTREAWLACEISLFEAMTGLTPTASFARKLNLRRQACREQSAMMKAFVRRNGAAMAKAREEYDAELAAAWERAAAATTATGTEETTPAASTFDLAYAAYLRYSEDKAGFDTAVFDTTTRALRSKHFVLRRTGRLAEAWERRNHRRICARRFADRFAADGDAKSGGGGAAVADAAVVALVVAPMLLGRGASQMCDCGMASVSSDAVDWVAFNREAFERAFARVDEELLKRGGDGEAPETPRVLDGCECEERDRSVTSCSSLVACPAVVRRVLKMGSVCCECEVEDALLAGDLLDLFS